MKPLISLRALRNSLLLFYDKALSDGNTVARLEDEIRLNKEKLHHNNTEGDILVRDIIDKLLYRILHGEKQNQ